MKLGYIYGAHGQGNKIYEPGDETRVGDFGYSSSYETFPRLYPDEIYAVLDPLDIDLDVCKQLDAVVYFIGGQKDKEFAEVIPDISCTVIAYEALGYRTLTTKAMKGIEARKKILDLSDVVLVPTPLGVDLIQMWTNTRVEFLRLPVPVQYALDVLEQKIPDDIPQFDIIAAYGPNQSQVYARNGYTNVLLAEKMMKECQEFCSIGMFACLLNKHVLLKLQDVLNVMGCVNVEIIPQVKYKTFLQILSKAKVCIDLDMGQSAGKFVVDCAIVKKPVIAANTISYAEAIYGDIKLHSPWDISSMMQTAFMVASGRWRDGWIQKAYTRGIKYTIESTAKVLVGIYNGV